MKFAFPWAKKESSEPIKNSSEQVAASEETLVTNEDKDQEVETKKEIDPTEGMSLEEKLRVMAEKKKEMGDLQNKRRDFYVDAKNFEDKMNALGLSDEKRKEIREQVLAEGGEFSREIEDLRKAYGFSPTPVEIYSARLKTLEAESNRIQEAMAWQYRDAAKLVDEMLKSMQSVGAMAALTRFTETCIYRKYENTIPEIDTFLNTHEWKNKDFTDQIIINKAKEFKDLLNKAMEEKSIYKTPGDVDAARNRLHRVVRLMDTTESTLNEALKKEGRFAEKE